MAMTPTLPDLPICDVLADILKSLAETPNLVITAPPGAGKTTLVPLALLEADWLNDRRILVLEPRRLAARSAARRMAALLEEEVGETVGYRVRFDSRVSKKTRIEVVTEGVFGRLLADDPSLESVGAVLFDEVHERSLGSDLSLALCLDLQSGLREDLRLIAMSATLDGNAFAALMNAPLIQSEGRSYPVTVIHRPPAANQRMEQAMVEAIREELKATETGDILAFLPGRGEIDRVADALGPMLPEDIDLHQLHGTIGQREQDAAISPPAKGRRKVVLATAIAETSLTIEGVNTVIDSGRARQPVYEPGTGITRLETVRASQATITQRAGRAGRLRPGRAIRLWHEGQTASLPAAPTPEILNADLSGLLLDLADWGVRDPDTLYWIDPPPKAATTEGHALLERMGALDAHGSLTTHGRILRSTSLPPRLAHMVATAAAHAAPSAYRAALLALLLQEQGAGGRDIDLAQRRYRCETSDAPREKRLVKAAKRLLPSEISTAHNRSLADGVLLAHAFPERIAKRRNTGDGVTVPYKLANGRGGVLNAAHPLAREEWIVVADMIGRAAGARITSAAAISREQIENHFEAEIFETRTASFNEEDGRFSAHQVRRIGSLNLSKPQRVDPGPEEIRTALLEHIQYRGLEALPWAEGDRSLKARLGLLYREIGPPWPDLSDAGLMDTLEDWLDPFLGDVKSLAALGGGRLRDALLFASNHPDMGAMDRLVPSHFETPSGERVPIDYAAEIPTIRVRPQQLFGLSRHPAVLEGRMPLMIDLISPAGRTIQLTRDLPGFWTGSWRDVRADMRGRYPKHPWPEDPAHADATNRAKPRKR